MSLNLERRAFLFSSALLVLIANPRATAAPTEPVRIVLGQSVAALDGPWRFHVGDDPRWADSDFDDSSWEVVDLTPPPGAHDDDVGLTGYVAGWSRRGHPGYAGYAWYRIRLAIEAPAEARLALTGPPSAESAYEVFVNGRRLGAAGDFSSSTPVAYSIQPRIFAVETRPGTTVVAFRVWMGPWAAGIPDAGGIHIAPLLGMSDPIEARYRLQWLQTVKGYVVDVIEPLLFIALAVMALSLTRFKPADSSLGWLALALVLLALVRSNQAFFFWTQLESVQGFEVVTVVLLTPLVLGAWTLAWGAWLRVPARLTLVVFILTSLYMGAQFLSRSWFHGVFPRTIVLGLQYLTSGVRLAFLLLQALIVFWGLRQKNREAWLSLPVILLLATGLFAAELTKIHIPGIWFPFGTGVSRTQFAYVAFDVGMFALLLRRQALFARQLAPVG